MKHQPIRLGISVCDALVCKGEIHLIKQVTPLFVRVQPLKGDGEEISLTHQEAADAIDDGRFSVQYGYFSSRQVARRAVAGKTVLSRLPLAVQQEAFWKEAVCTTIEELEAKGEFNRSSRRWSEFRPKLEACLMAKLKNMLQSGQPGARFEAVLLRRFPGRTAAMAWLREWEASRDPMVLVKKSIFNGSNAMRIETEREVIIQKKLEEYMSPSRMSPSLVCDEVNREIRSRSKVRGLHEEQALEPVSLSTIERRIRDLPKFEVTAAREGVAVAKSKLGAYGKGLTVHAALQRIEMDEWEIDLMAWLVQAGVDVTQDGLRDIVTRRYFVCVALDSASRCLLGMKLSLKPCAEDAKAVLWMAMRNKSKLAKQLGCETDWKQHGHVFHVAVDNGPAFVSSEFKAALSDLRIDYSVLPAGIAKLRARMERLFLTLIKRLMPFLTGRTFSNPQERGDYPSEKYAVHTAESIIELLMRFVVDVYHNRTHRSLASASPNMVWDRLIKEFGWSPARSQHELRHALGLAMTRKTGRHGITVNGVNYHSKRLADHFQKRGKQQVDIRIDSEDMGHISVWLDNGLESGWSTLKSGIEGLEGVSFAAWEKSVFELRQHNRSAAALSQDVVDRAMARIREIDAEQCAARQLGPIGDTFDQIKRAQKETFWGLALGSDPELGLSDGDQLPGKGSDLLSNEIAPLDSADDPKGELPPPTDPDTPETKMWSFDNAKPRSTKENKDDSDD